MKKAYITKKFGQASQDMLEQVNRILSEYESQGYRLTLRQLYYQLVSRDIIPNNLRSYKNLGNLVSDARLAGLIDWNMIEDRGRGVSIPNHWENPGDIVKAAASQFRIDKWVGQPYRVTVMVEKDALSGVLAPVTRRLDIGLSANKGYSSSSALYELGRQFYWQIVAENTQPVIIYLGDHDPSGMDMTRDIAERLAMFAEGKVIVERVALNYDQIELWNPPENPAKQTDARFAAYAAQFGESSWELDAVEPRELDRLVTNIVLQYRDDELWQAAVAREQAMRDTLDTFAKTWSNE